MKLNYLLHLNDLQASKGHCGAPVVFIYLLIRSMNGSEISEVIIAAGN